MTDETTKGGTGEGDIEFNPPVPEIYGDAKTPIPQSGDQLAPQATSDAIAEDVGLKLSPTSRPLAGKFSDFKQILQKVKLPERRKSEASPPPPLSPSAPPLGRAAPATPPAARDVQAVPESQPANADTRSPVVSLHTMKDDIQDAVRDQQISMVRAVSLEAQKRAKQVTVAAPIPTAPASGPKKHRVFVPITIIFLSLALGSGALYAAYFLTAKQAVPVTIATGIVFAEQQSVLPIGAESVGTLKQILAGMLASQAGSAGSIMQVTPIVSGASGQASRKATPEEFLHALGAHPSDELLRSLGSDFFLGIHGADGPSAIFIIPVVSYDHAFAGMLAWEGTIDADLAPLFKQISPYLPSVSSTTVPARRTFQDTVMRNYDVRVLRDDGGSIILYYSFPTQNFLIIASSPYSFPEVLSRLQAGRKL